MFGCPFFAAVFAPVDIDVESSYDVGMDTILKANHIPSILKYDILYQGFFGHFENYRPKKTQNSSKISEKL